MFTDVIKLNSKIGVGPKLMQTLNEEGIFTITNLIELFPIRYIDYSLTELVDGYVLIKAKVLGSIKSLHLRNNLNSLTFFIDYFGENIKVIIFNRLFLKSKLFIGQEIFIEGKYEDRKKCITASNIFLKLEVGKIKPVYQSKASSTEINKIIVSSLERYEKYIDEELPLSLLEKYKLIGLHDALMKIHNPINMDDVKQASRRLKYEEFLRFQLKLQYIRSNNQLEYKKPKKWDISEIKNFISTIPFELTDDQKEVVNTIFKDLKSTHAANRLIEGDVGSGKTVVAAISLYAVVLDRCQGCLMAPTEILAVQHYTNLVELFKSTNVKIDLLTSSIKGKKRQIILDDLKNGITNIIVGTHALISEEVIYNNLGLVITDEQHRFGVNQRQNLRKKGDNPDVLYLSATPIPRTLAIGMFGDMDISYIKSKPIGRKPIKTKYISSKQLTPILSFIKDEIAKGHQAYIIAPLIEETEKSNLHDVLNVYNEVSKYFVEYKVEYLHGKLKPQEKEEIMDRFVKNEGQILVSTTVIEVGVDNKNATVILILDAERFGLSQLHQLRGRVGRGGEQSYCFLVSDNSDVERLKILEETNDGFELAEHDLRLRGPGDFFGNKQSGIPTFKIGDIIKDYKIIEIAKMDATNLIETEEIKKYNRLYQHIKNEIDNSSIFD